jgi:signal transduction histidine kinase
MTRRWSMRTRFVAAASACLLPLLAVVLFVLDQSLNNSRDQILDNEIAVSNVVATSLSQTLQESESLLTALAQNPDVQALHDQEARQVFGQAQAYRPSVKGIFLINPDGQVVTSFGIDPAPLLATYTVSTATNNALKAGATGVSNAIAVPGSEGANVVAQVTAVLPNTEDTSATQQVEGQPVGAIGVFLDVERLQRAFAPASEFGGDTTITIVAEDGMVVVNQPAAGGQEPDLSEKLAGPIDEAIAGKRTRQTYRDATGVERLAVITPVDYEGAKWAVLVTSPSPTAYGPNRNLLERGLMALAAAVVLTLALAVLFGELTARSLRQLTRRARAIAGGQDQEPVEAVGRGEVANLSAAIRDMANRLTTQVRDTETAREEIERQAELLRDLLRRTVRLQEDERRRIAGEIHDAVSPLITGALFQARAMRLSNGQTGEANGHGSENGHGPRDDGLATVGDLLEQAMAELHDVIFALRPPDLDDLGVVAAIDRYVQQIDRTGLPSRLEVIGEPQRLSPEARLGVYRIVQEALHNALRHAHADEAVVKMEWLDDRLRVTIRDNGSGFDPDQAPSPTSLGLLSMRERAAAIGATLEIASRPGSGTAIIIERPLSDDLVTEPAPDTAPVDEPAEAPAEPATVG